MAKGIYCTLLILALLCNSISFGQAIGPEIKRILFLGNSITWAGNYVNDIEAYLRVQYPERRWEFINAGLSSETVSGLSEPGHAGGNFPRPDLHERLVRVLEQTKPDLVFACYGMNDGIYMPFADNRFQKFREGINWLHGEVLNRGARIIHITPPVYDEARGTSTGYAAVLDRYAAWLLTKRQMKWEVIDVHFPMKKYLEAHRKADAQFGLDGFALASDGVHPGEVGHWLIARQVLSYLRFGEVAKKRSITESLEKLENAPKYIKLVAQRQNLLRDAWLTATGHKRPGLPVGLSLNEAELQSADLLQQINALLRPGQK